MLYLTCVILLIALIYYLLIKKESIFAPIPMFSLVWVLIILFYKSGYVELYPLDFRLELVVFIGTVGFLLGGQKYSLRFRLHRKIDKTAYSYDLRSNIAVVLSIICIVIQAYRGMTSINLLRSGFSFEQITRNQWYFQGNGSFSTFLSVFFIAPFTYAIIPIGAYHLVKNNGDKRVVACSIILALLTTIQHGGRASLLYFIVYVFAYRSVLGKKTGLKLKTKIGIVAISVALLVVVDKLSQSRGTTSYVDSIYIYVCGCLPNLNQRLFTGTTVPLTFGGASLYGYIAPIFYLLKGIGIPYPQFFSKLTDIVNVENVIKIGPAKSYNAFVSIYYYLFLDGRELFAFIGAFLISLIASSQYRKAKETLNERNVIFYGLMLHQVMFSMIRVSFSTYSFALSFIYVLLLYRILYKEEPHARTI